MGTSNLRSAFALMAARTNQWSVTARTMDFPKFEDALANLASISAQKLVDLTPEPPERPAEKPATKSGLRPSAKTQATQAWWDQFTDLMLLELVAFKKYLTSEGALDQVISEKLEHAMNELAKTKPKT